MPYSRSKKSSAAPFEFFAMNSVRHRGYRHLPTCTNLHSEPGLQGGTALCNYKVPPSWHRGPHRRYQSYRRHRGGGSAQASQELRARGLLEALDAKYTERYVIRLFPDNRSIHSLRETKAWRGDGQARIRLPCCMARLTPLWQHTSHCTKPCSKACLRHRAFVSASDRIHQ